MTTADRPADEALSAIDVLERFYAAERTYMAAGGAVAGASFDDMADTLDPAIKLYQSPDLPWGGEYTGHQGFRDWSIAMSSHFDVVDVQDARFFEQGDQVVIVCRLVTHAIATDETLDYPMVQVVTVRGNKITEFRPFYWNVPHYAAVGRATARRNGAGASDA